MPHDKLGIEGRLLKLGLIGTFLAAVGVVGSRPPRRQGPIGPLEIALMGLASHRIGRMLAFERVATPLREPFTDTVPDDSGVDETVVARGRGLQRSLGELLSCPMCVGTWAALALYIGLTVLPGPTRVLVTVLSAAGIAELTNGVVEQLEWSGRAARKRAA